MAGVDGQARVLVIDDEESYLDALYTGLSREQFAVELAYDGPQGLKAYEADPPDIVILDLMLPGMSGIEVFRRMRDIAPVPVVMLTALADEVDVVLGLEMGAEDYVTKPFQLRELVARMNAVLRRLAEPPTVSPSIRAPARPQEVVSVGPLVMDHARRIVTLSGRPVALSRREYDLLALLVSPPNQVRRREELIDLLWSGRELADTRTLDTHVRRLRTKLEDDPANPKFLVTVRGVGFRVESESPV